MGSEAHRSAKVAKSSKPFHAWNVEPGMCQKGFGLFFLSLKKTQEKPRRMSLSSFEVDHFSPEVINRKECVNLKATPSSFGWEEASF